MEKFGLKKFKLTGKTVSALAIAALLLVALTGCISFSLPLVLALSMLTALIFMLYRQIANLEKAEQDLLSAIDVRKQAEGELRAKEELLHMMVTNIKDYGIYFLDKDGYIQSWNEGARQIKGYTAEEIIGCHFSTFYPEEDRAAGKPELELSLAQKKGRLEDTGYRLRKDGTSFWANVVITALYDDAAKLRGFVKVTRDISQRKQLEDELFSSRDQALQASRLKSEFLANMSHEIRTPLNGIIGMTNILQRTKLNEQQHEYVNVLHESANSLLGIINDILDFSKVEAGKLSLETMEFEPVAVVESIAEMLADQAQKQNVSMMTFVEPSAPQVLLGDPGRLRQVLLNLTGNAIKFAPNGEVVVKALPVCTSATHATIKFLVEDTGTGISDEQHSRLFQPFVQGDGSTARKFGGTGLGLAISKSLVDMMGGEIGLESRQDKGSTFWFTVPLALPDKAELKASQRPDITGFRVLVVDDEPLARNVIHSYLISWGMRNGMVSNASDALATLRRAYHEGEPYDLALVDLFMPGKDGIDLAQDILQDAKIRDTRLILVTAYDTPGIGEQSLGRGFSGYLRKPVRQSQLFDCIATVLKRTASPELASSNTAWRPQDYQMARRKQAVSLNTSAKILLVEDNQVNQQVALLQLQQLGLSADAASDGKEALAAILRVKYDLILMDCQMPELDGFETTGLIRRQERPGDKHVAIIAMTAQAMVGDREKCLSAGMDDYLSKPIDEQQLAAVLSRWIPGQAAGVEPANEQAAFSSPASIAAQGEEWRSNIAFFQFQFLEQSLGRQQALRLSKLFKDSAPAVNKRLLQAIEEKDADKLRQVSHELKGSAAAIGADKVRQIAAELEELSCRHGDFEKAAQLASELQVILAETFKQIESLAQEKQI